MLLDLITKLCCKLGWHEEDEVVEVDTYDNTAWRVRFCRQCGVELSAVPFDE